MNTLTRFSAVSAACLIFFSCSANKPAEQIRSITVSGSGTASAAPDQASFNVSVTTQEWVAKTASDENAVIMTKVHDALAAAGVKAEDMSTSGYSIVRNDTWSNGRSWPGKYSVRNSYDIVLHDPSTAGAVIDAAVAAGATEVSSLSYSVSDTEALLRQARTAAVQQAHDTASLLAGSSGCRLGEVITISENSGYYPRLANTMMKTSAVMAESDAATPLSAGKTELSASVTVTYALQ